MRNREGGSWPMKRFLLAALLAVAAAIVLTMLRVIP